jgi:predicted TIM-barrel fold metal-dependent hydrolase
LGRLSGVAEKMQNGVEYELKRLHYEIANSANRSAMSALMNLFPMSQIMFGSDYPFVPVGVTANGMNNLGLSPADLQAIGQDNAVALLPRLKAQRQTASGSWSGLGRVAVSECAS